MHIVNKEEAKMRLDELIVKFMREGRGPDGLPLYDQSDPAVRLRVHESTIKEIEAFLEENDDSDLIGHYQRSGIPLAIEIAEKELKGEPWEIWD